MNRLIVTRTLSRDDMEEIRRRWNAAWRGKEAMPIIVLPDTLRFEVFSYPMREAAG